jgi:hypothetical protein
LRLECELAFRSVQRSIGYRSSICPEMKASEPNQSVQPTVGSSFARLAFRRQWRLPPVADAFGSAE